ncbi:hypothetical protein EYC80_010487 [Monilinia laxa]|uniref:Uncharacterized protein n=1 Tax=Monilinia laxa TaxID=61186 RepID=A0A5N6JQT9_MONLA|nr:hypothetical protein EYC80_010487 [Monilinia laxa]
MDNQRSKTIYQLDTPFTAVQWPEISSKHQETVLELLCSILSPIGTHRSNHITPSKGKRSKKRKRRAAKTGEEKSSETPPPPEMSPYIITGLNSIHRTLERSIKKAPENSQALDIPTPQTPHFSTIFFSRSTTPPILTSHLPQLIATASKAHPSKPLTKIVPLPQGSETRIAAALHLPRVSFLGILDDAPNSKALLDVIRDCVGTIEIPWLDEVKRGEYLEARIRVIQTTIGNSKSSEKKG